MHNGMVVPGVTSVDLIPYHLAWLAKYGCVQLGGTYLPQAIRRNHNLFRPYFHFCRDPLCATRPAHVSARNKTLGRK